MRLDPIGTISLTIGLICLIAVLQTSSSSSKFTSSDIYLAVAAGSGLVTFVIHETFIRPDLALIPRHMITQRVVWSCCFVVFLLFAGFINYVFFLSMFFQVRLAQLPISLHILIKSHTVYPGRVSPGKCSEPVALPNWNEHCNRIDGSSCYNDKILQPVLSYGWRLFFCRSGIDLTARRPDHCAPQDWLSEYAGNRCRVSHASKRCTVPYSSEGERAFRRQRTTILLLVTRSVSNMCLLRLPISRYQS